MPLPVDLTSITVTGNYPDGSGNHLFGYVTFTPSTDLTDPTGHVIIRAAPIPAPLVRGSFSIQLACTDNADLSPSGWYWIVTEVIGNYAGNLPARPYNVLLPQTLGSSVNLASLVQVSPGPAVSTLYGVLASPNTNTWTSSQVFNGALRIPPGAASGDVLTSDAQGNATWQPATGGVQLGGDIGGTNVSPTVVGLHLTVPIANGGTGATTQQAAINALTGAQTAGRYLRSNGTNAALSAIQVADVPVLNQDTTGVASNVSGTVAFSHGGTGQATQQAAINALSGAVTAGRYLRGDGTNVSLSAIQSADLPTASTSVFGTVEYDNTVANLQPQGTATLDTTGKVTGVAHVHPLEPWRFSVMAAGAKGDGKCSATGSVTATSNVVTIGESAFVSGDVGKLIMVKYAVTLQGNTGQSTAVGTITGFTSATQVTASFTAAVTGTALTVLWATDDTAAIQTAIGNANTYAQAHGLGEIFFPAPANLFYGVGGPLKFTDGTNSVFNSQLTVPVNAEQNAGVTLVFRGTGDNGQARYWSQDFPIFNGGIVSFGVFTSQAAQATSDTHSVSNGGNPSVIGGPTGKFNYGVVQGANLAPTYSNTCVVFLDFTILTTHSNSGWTYCAANMFGVARFHAKNFTYGTTGVVQYYKNQPGLGDFSNVTSLSGGASIGILMPSNGNNASNYLQNIVCNGGYTFGLFATEHTVGNGVTILYCWSGLCPVGNYTDSAGAGVVSALHASYFDQACVESCSFHLNIIGAGASAIGPMVHMVLDTEGTVQIRDGTTNNGTGLSAALGEIRLVGSPSTITVNVGTGTGATGGTGLRIIKEQILPGVPSSGIPVIAANTGVINTLWRPATVYLLGGANLTTIQVSRLAGGVSSVPFSTVADFTTAGTIAVPFPVRLGPGQWIKVNTSSGTTVPTATWVLD